MCVCECVCGVPPNGPALLAAGSSIIIITEAHSIPSEPHQKIRVKESHKEHLHPQRIRQRFTVLVAHCDDLGNSGASVATKTLNGSLGAVIF